MADHVSPEMGKRLRDAGVTAGHKWTPGDWGYMDGWQEPYTLAEDDIDDAWTEEIADGRLAWLPTAGQLLEMLLAEGFIVRMEDELPGYAEYRVSVWHAGDLRAAVSYGPHLPDLLAEALLAVKGAK